MAFLIRVICVVSILCGAVVGCNQQVAEKPTPPMEPVVDIEPVIVTVKEVAISEYDQIVKRYARRYGFDWRLISAQIFAESTFREQVVSYCGAVGLMQIMPSTAKWLGVNPDLLIQPEANISLGCYYNFKIYNNIEGALTNQDHLSFMLASYNCGPGRVKRIRKSIDDGRWIDIDELLPLETQQYVPKIFDKYEEYRRIKL